MKILVTGGSGFLGSHIVDRLLKENRNVIVLDIWKSNEMKIHQNNPLFEFVEGSVMDKKLLSSLMKKVDKVIHLAGILGTSESITMYDMEEVFSINLIGTVRVLDAARENKVKRVIIPTTPNTPEKINPYKITKQSIEKICKLYSTNFEIEATALRLGNVYGSRERWIGSPFDAPYNYQKIIPTFIINALEKKPIAIFGDGDQKSEYTFIDDVVEVFVRTLDSEKEIGGEIIEVGRNKSHSVNEVIGILEKILSVTIQRKYVNMRPGEVKLDFSLSSDKLNEFLDYEIKYELEEGLIDTISYYKQFVKNHK